MVLARRLVGVEHPEDLPTALVHGTDETQGEGGPAIAHDQDVELLVERDRGIDDDLTDPCATVVGEVSMQLLDPLLGREDQGDGRFHRGHRAVGSAVAPVVDPIECLRCRSRARSSAGREGKRHLPVGDRRRDQLRLPCRHGDRHRERARALADAAATPCVDGYHLGVGDDDRDRALAGEHHVDAIAGSESATDRTRRVDRDAHRPQPVTGRTGSQRSGG